MSLRRRAPRPSKTIATPSPEDDCFTHPPWGAEQAQALAELRAFLKAKDRDFHLLCGFAGTGKSTICTAFLRELPAHKVRLCASTNKAARVLMDMATASKLKAPITTLHKLLKLVPERRGEAWVLRQVCEPDLSGIELIVVDECSMIGQELWAHLQELPCRYPIKVLFMGDPAQLPPVSEDISPSFSIPHASTLREVFRQGADHPILAYSMLLRREMEKMTSSAITPPQPAPGIEVYEQRQDWERQLLKAFERPSARRNVDEVRVLTYTNRRVNHWNRLIDEKIFGANEAPFSKEQALVLTSPVTKGGWDRPWQVVLPSDEPVRLVACRPLPWRGCHLWELDLVSLDGTTVTVTHIPAELKERVETELQSWQLERQGKLNPHDVIEKWRRKCVGVQAASAITVHRSQGSSFDTVFLDWPSISNCSDPKLKIQLLYVAVTRAKRRLCVLLPKAQIK